MCSANLQRELQDAIRNGRWWDIRIRKCPHCNSEMETLNAGGNYICKLCGLMSHFKGIKKYKAKSKCNHNGSVKTDKAIFITDKVKVKIMPGCFEMGKHR